ncbi:MAG: DUF6158 family protein [Actinomycetota bacterium]|nr:DUF6158 family protein [Actinomycetota bacterium]
MPKDEGIAANELNEEDLRRELTHMYETREDTLMNGSADAFDTHTERMMELEKEFIRRFPREVEPAARRTRTGARRTGVSTGKKRAAARR